MAISTESLIQKMAKTINLMASELKSQSQEIAELKKAIFADANMLDRRITIAEAARILGVSRPTIYHMIEDGRITTACRRDNEAKIKMSHKEINSFLYSNPSCVL